MKQPMIKMGPIVLDCGVGQAKTLSEFYSKLLGGQISHPSNNGTAAITAPDGKIMAFQEVDGYIPPTWPWEQGKQGQMMHFDLVVEDLQAAIAFAVSCGAVLTEQVYFDDSRTLLDPAGHTFCLDTFHG